MTDPVITVARAAGERLADDYGEEIRAEVEAALHARKVAQRPAQYVDPVSIGSLIVSITTLAWSVYSDLRMRTRQPSSEVFTRQLKLEIAELDTQHAADDRIADVVVTEVIRTAER
jgi:hypothetical protein